jgi:hypothetical protein
MNDNEKYQLKQMIEQNNVVDNTNTLRELKHSSVIKQNVERLLELKKIHADLLVSDKQKFEEIALQDCGFLFFNYMQLYNSILKENLNPTILNQLLTILSKIENGECDQHEASYEVGKLLKAIYIDTTLQRIRENDESAKVEYVEPKTIKWSDYKNNIL